MKWRACTGVLCDRNMPIWLKSKVYRTVVRPVALYASETWPLTARIEQRMSVMEMKMCRWSLGLTRLDRQRNDDVRKRFGVVPIVDKMREGRLRWYGHVMRRPTESVARSAHEMVVKGKRPQGRPKTRWMDVIKKDMKNTGVKSSDAQDRTFWRKKTRSADPNSTRD